MRVRAFIIAMLAALFFAASAQADTFELVLPATGSYFGGSLHNMSVDFGRAFTSIQQMSIVWTGSVQGGWEYGNVEGLAPGPWPGSFNALFKKDNGAYAQSASISGLGVSTYPVAQPFSETRAFSWFGTYPSTWDFLLDGQTTMAIQFSPAVFAGGASGIPPSGSLSSVKLVLNATVPEPSCMATLAATIMGCGLLRRRRS